MNKFKWLFAAFLAVSLIFVGCSNGDDDDSSSSSSSSSSSASLSGSYISTIQGLGNVTMTFSGNKVTMTASAMGDEADTGTFTVNGDTATLKFKYNGTLTATNTGEWVTFLLDIDGEKCPFRKE